MRDNQLINDLKSIENIKYTQEIIKQLQSEGVRSYSKLFALLRNNDAKLQLRLTACDVISRLYRSIDQRRAVPALLIALQSNEITLRREATISLTMFYSKLAKVPLLKIAQDKSEDQRVRIFAIQALSSPEDMSVFEVFRQIFSDENDDLEIRCVALENSHTLLSDDSEVSTYIELLSDKSCDIRFWAGFVLANLIRRHENVFNLSMSLSKLDKTVAYDHTLPTLWGWHVDREVLYALESIYFQPYRQFFIDENGEQNEYCWGIYLISSAHEYYRFMSFNRSPQSSSDLVTKPESQMSLNINLDWFKTELKRKWKNIDFEVRSESHAYTLSWLLQIDGLNLLGGLHRDGYSIVLTGNGVYEFAVWYRSIIQGQKLFLYNWAEPGICLKPAMTVEQIEQAMYREFETFELELKKAGR